jgi:hypothetical protein
MTARRSTGRFAGYMLLALFISCKEDFELDLKPNEPQLVVEAYINNLMPEYNYVILSKSMDYFTLNFQGLAVSNAQVAITEGDKTGPDSYEWNTASRIVLEESNDARIPDDYRKGLYVDQQTIATMSSGRPQGLIAKPGKYYLLEISYEGKRYSSITNLPEIVQLDSLNTGYRYIDAEDNNTEKARITVNYRDPDTLGNRQLFYWRNFKNRESFGWGALATNRRLNGTDDLSNGEYIRLAQPNGFFIGEKVDYFLISVNRAVYTFWDSFNKARNNEGPFATPVQLISNIEGPNVTGCFSGFTVSTKSIVVK